MIVSSRARLIISLTSVDKPHQFTLQEDEIGWRLVSQEVWAGYTYSYEEMDWEILGFGGQRFQSKPPAQNPATTTTVFILPYLFPVFITAILPILWLIRFRRAYIQRRRKEQGLCVKCGYNLTGSPGPRCS